MAHAVPLCITFWPLAPVQFEPGYSRVVPLALLHGCMPFPHLTSVGPGVESIDWSPPGCKNGVKIKQNETKDLKTKEIAMPRRARSLPSECVKGGNIAELKHQKTRTSET